VLLREPKSPLELLVADVAEHPPGRDARVPERLGEPHVPDPGNEPLVEESLPDDALRIREAKPTNHILDLGLRGEQIRAKSPDGALVEREDRSVPLPRLPRASPEHEPRAAACGRATSLDPPTAAHPQVAANDDASLEPEQEVLPDRLHALEHTTVDGLRYFRRQALRVRALGLDPLPDERLEERRDAPE
jgi:hypothetical protein